MQQNEFGEQEETLVSEDFVVPSYAVSTSSRDSSGKRITIYEFDGMQLR
mgnify:FL=1